MLSNSNMKTAFLFIFTFLLQQRFGSSITFTSNVTCLETERQSLLAIKRTITDKHNLLSTWSGVECCECEGVVPHHLGNLSRLQYLDLRNFFIPADEGTTFLPAPSVDDLRWVSSLSSLRYLDLSGIVIDEQIDLLHPVNMLPSLLTLNLASSLNMIHKTPIKSVNFTSLNSLDLSMNGINSTIPLWLSNLTGLMHLNLHEYKFHGKIPDFIGTFYALASIKLSHNSFKTLIPDLFCNLSSLVHLDLSGNILDLSSNMFSGPLPSNLGLFSRLEDPSLYDNQFSGNIPMSLGQLSKLKNLDLSRNSLVGVIYEAHFTNLMNLISLDLSLNWLALNFSSRWIPPFQLQLFFASSCNIGPYFPNWLHTQTHLQMLDLSNSSIKGTLPEWFESILTHLFYLDLSKNEISGKLPLFHFQTSDQVTNRIFKMNSNKFEGSLAAFPLNVNLLDLSDNLLSGELPQTNGTMNLTLTLVNLSNNRFIGNIPVDLCKPLQGLVPSSLGSLTLLMTLHLHNNRLEGNLPLSLQNLTRLITMDIGYNFLVGDIPFWSGERLLNLRILNLQSNKFTGKIPLQFCQLDGLMHLNLAQNNIIGTIPPYRLENIHYQIKKV
ncbi:hypothetical protein E3N88_37767 [Mikania micrantha]|uniref:Uncharacterized protein n=1 Tax=Mikania micrantha TaxID=192012 RepID=A0A5N6LS97_9ASTR|nr:hypothetical protein E3N88_37767 [Mikania micrantha]